MKRTITAAALALLAGAAQAEFYSGNELLDLLSSPPGSYKEAFGMGYVAGAHDAGRTVHHCSPDTVTVRQAADVVRQALEKLPHHRHKSADVIVAAALGTFWPCAKTAPSRNPTNL